MPPLIETVSAAVTPVVLVSASAVLILGVGNKHQNMSDRVRSLNAERRSHDISGERKASIERQIALLRRRIRFSRTAHIVLYVSIVCFIAMALLLLFAPGAFGAGVGLLIGGVALMLGAVICEILELRLADQTLAVEVGDLDQVR